jgi:short-subunit dehydrogenase
MPSSARSSFIEPSEFAALTLRALERGRSEVVIPAHMRLPMIIHALFPEWMGRAVGKVKMKALERAGARE